MDALYQGSATMQWYDWYRDGEGLYVASEDTTRQAVCLHIERDSRRIQIYGCRKEIFI